MAASMETLWPMLPTVGAPALLGLWLAIVLGVTVGAFMCVKWKRHTEASSARGVSQRTAPAAHKHKVTCDMKDGTSNAAVSSPVPARSATERLETHTHASPHSSSVAPTNNAACAREDRDDGAVSPGEDENFTSADVACTPVNSDAVGEENMMLDASDTARVCERCTPDVAQAPAHADARDGPQHAEEHASDVMEDPVALPSSRLEERGAAEDVSAASPSAHTEEQHDQDEARMDTIAAPADMHTHDVNARPALVEEVGVVRYTGESFGFILRHASSLSDARAGPKRRADGAEASGAIYFAYEDVFAEQPLRRGDRVSYHVLETHMHRVVLDGRVVHPHKSKPKAIGVRLLQADADDVASLTASVFNASDISKLPRTSSARTYNPPVSRMPGSRDRRPSLPGSVDTGADRDSVSWTAARRRKASRAGPLSSQQSNEGVSAFPVARRPLPEGEMSWRTGPSLSTAQPAAPAAAAPSEPTPEHSELVARTGDFDVAPSALGVPTSGAARRLSMEPVESMPLADADEGMLSARDGAESPRMVASDSMGSIGGMIIMPAQQYGAAQEDDILCSVADAPSLPTITISSSAGYRTGMLPDSMLAPSLPLLQLEPLPVFPPIDAAPLARVPPSHDMHMSHMPVPHDMHAPRVHAYAYQGRVAHASAYQGAYPSRVMPTQGGYVPTPPYSAPYYGAYPAQAAPVTYPAHTTVYHVPDPRFRQAAPARVPGASYMYPSRR